jgi:hypothetical protein
MMSSAGQVTQDDVDRAFQTGEVYNAPDETLMEYLRVLCTGHVPNEMVRHRETNRCITINTLVNVRLTKKIDRTNTILAIVGIVLAVVGVAATIVQVLP